MKNNPNRDYRNRGYISDDQAERIGAVIGAGIMILGLLGICTTVTHFILKFW